MSGVQDADSNARTANSVLREAGRGVGSQGNAVVRLAFNILMVIVLTLGVCAACGIGFDAAGGGDVAVAADFDDGAGYTDAFIGDKGWKADVIENADPESELDPGAYGENLVGGISDFFYSLSWIIIALTVIMAVGRFSVRALLALLYGGNKGSVDFNAKSDIWVIFMTSKERQQKKLEPVWLLDMIKETFLFLAIGIAAGAIVGVLVGVSSFVMDEIVKSSNETGISSFDVSGLHMGTSK